MKKFFPTFLFIALLFAGSPLVASAAVLFSEPQQVQVVPHQRFAIDLFLDTEKEEINALEGKIVFPSDLLELQEVRDGSSIVNFWMERLQTGQSPVAFSGIIPGGYRFPKGFVLTLVFEAKQLGKGTIGIEQARTLRNDGKGTPSSLTLNSSSVTVAETVSSPSAPVPTIVDTNAPEPFVPTMSQDPSIFSGKWFLAFATQDKGSGIDHYEVQETHFWGKGRWVIAESPYELRSQDPTRTAYVKAVDRAGNERIGAALPPHPRDTTYDAVMVFAILLLMVMIISFLYRKHTRSYLKKRIKK